MSSDSSTKTGTVSTGAEPLLAEFAKPTYAEWREAAEQALKGAPFEKVLLTHTPEGFTLQPIYNAEDLEQVAHLGSLPGQAPYVRGTRATGHAVEPWLVSQTVDLADAMAANRVLRVELERGSDAINLSLDRATRAGLDPGQAPEGTVGDGGVSIFCGADLEDLLAGVALDEHPLQLYAGERTLPILGLLAAFLRAHGVEPTALRGWLGADPLGELARSGVAARALPSCYDELAAVAAWAAEHAPALRTVFVGAHPYHDAGASAVEELGFALATGVEYLRQLTERGIPVDAAASQLQFGLSVGTSFFMEIAKLRAARLTWAQAVAAFGGAPAAQQMKVHARTSYFGQTVLDPNVNLLRATTETFAAAVGGADSVQASPYDAVIREPDDFSRRVARNMQVVLKDEANLGRVVDPAGGSWYVETLTDQLGRQAWELLQEVEQRGGMERALIDGFPQQRIAETAKAKQAALASRKQVQVGTNMYPNTIERPLEPRGPDLAQLHNERGAAAAAERNAMDGGARQAALTALASASAAELVERAITAASAGATLGQIGEARAGDAAPIEIEPLAIHRAAEPYEQLGARAAAFAERTGARPGVFLANLGPIPQHKARADFSTGFFQVGGFEVLGNDGFPTPEEAAEAAIASGAQVVVICSTDPTYPELVPPLAAKLKAARPEVILVLAGYPKDQIDAHREAGVDEFIHLKANNYQLLVDMLDKIGA